MIKNELKQGLEHAWESLSGGWREVRERAAGALTRFMPSRNDAPDIGPEDEPLMSTGWGVLAADVFEDDEKVVVRLEAPGMRKEDMRIEWQGDALVVQGRKRFERETGDGRYRVMQCSYGSFRRVVELPVPVRGDKAAARYRDGVLRIELPKREVRRSQRIPVRMQ